MDILNLCDEAAVSTAYMDVNTLRADSPTWTQEPTQSSLHSIAETTTETTPRHTRNFSRKLYSMEAISPSSSRCPSGEVVNLTSGSAFMDLLAARPLDFIDGNVSTVSRFNGQGASESCGAVHSPAADSTTSLRKQGKPIRLASLPSSPVMTKPVRPAFGRSISMMDSRAKSNPAKIEKQIQLPEPLPTLTARLARPSLMRSPTVVPTSAPIASPPRTPSTKFASSVGEKLGWLRSRAWSNVSNTSNTSTTTMVPAPPSPAASQQAQEDAELEADDPLINLDISTALFPTGIADFTDSSSFNGLLANATALIETLQTSYKQRTTQLHQLRSKYAGQVEDLDEAEERSRHLRMQLSSMSARMTETELSLRSQLAEECQLRKALEIKEKERAARRRTNPYRRTSVLSTTVAAPASPPASPSAASDSDSTTGPLGEGSDSGFESDAESHTSSRYSPTSSPVLHSAFSATSSSAASTASAASPKQLQHQQLQHLQQQQREIQTATPSLISSCTSPEPSEASWERNSAIAGPTDPLAENFALRHRVAELESAVEACLRLI